ncbi:MAG TPA: transglutaminase-like domain-containing protein [Myxococcales bacterium]|nr:transglutaminase-like domain-containing protein [Myxococcales bacterium]
MAHRDAIAVILSLCASGAPAAELFLANIPITAEKGARLSATDPLLVRLEVWPIDPRKRVELRDRLDARWDEAGATVRLAGYPSSADRVLPGYLRPSFLVDFDEPPVAALRERVQRDSGEHPRTRQLEAFVARYVEKKVYTRAHDPASVVARRREGDCTEHAVLLAALARMFGIPARLVVGLALIAPRGQLRAVGHEWVETFEEGSWRPADAIQVDESSVFVRLPLSVVSDEGPGFALSLLGSLSPLDLREVRLLAPSAEEVKQ